MVKVAEGVTDLHAAIHRPSDFDPSRSYPVVEVSLREWQPTSLLGSWSMPDYGQSTAELGSSVVAINARCGSGRSAEFYEAGRGMIDG